MMEAYTVAYWGIFSVIVVLILQGAIAAGSKASQPGAIPGKMGDDLSHSSFVFRSNRTFLNSLENFPAFLGSAVLAILIAADPFWTGTFIVIYSLSRIAHMVLYYVIATETNPSPRSYFFMLGLLANIALLVLCGITLA